MFVKRLAQKTDVRVQTEIVSFGIPNSEHSWLDGEETDLQVRGGGKGWQDGTSRAWIGNLL
jgi:hypothetical protein